MLFVMSCGVVYVKISFHISMDSFYFCWAVSK